MSVDTVRPPNRRTHHHVSSELRASEQRQRCLALRLVGRTVRDIAREVGISPSTVNGYVQQALRDSRVAVLHLGAEIREQERVRLQAIIDRWQPVATGPYRSREAARAAELVCKASEDLRVLFGGPAAAPPPPPVAPGPEPAVASSRPSPEPTLEQRIFLASLEDVVLKMAIAGLLPQSSYDDAWDALEVWQSKKYKPKSKEVEDYLRKEWRELLVIPLD